MKIRWKIFLILWSMVILFVSVIVIGDKLYLEKYYINEKEKDLKAIGKLIVESEQIINFRALEVQNNVEILIKDKENLRKEEYKNIFTNEEIKEMKERLSKGEVIIKNLLLEDYRDKVIILFMEYKRDRYLEIITPISVIQDNLEISFSYNLRIIFILFAVGSIIAGVFSRAIVLPILRLKDITNSISKLDFSQNFKEKRKDEIGELGNSINKMSEILRKNIEEITEVNQKLRNDIEREMKIEKLGKEFVAYVSHELKTPIAIIQGYSQGLKENINSEEDREFYCDVIIEESQKMSKLVRELLLMSQVEAGYYKNDKSKYNLYDLINEVVERYDISSENIEVIGGENYQVYCDEITVDRVLDNLIGNAVKYKLENTDVMIRLREKKDSWKIVISNLTNNIDKKDLSNIWAPFLRLNSSIGKKGHGLGLALVKSFLQNHKSKFGVYLSEKNYVNFWFEVAKFQSEKGEN